MNKGLLIGAAVVLLIPIILALMMQGSISFEQINSGLTRDGFNVANLEEVSSPRFGAKMEYRMTVNGSRVQVFQFDNQQRLEACYKLWRDPARAREELAKQGVPPQARFATVAAQNDWFVLAITSSDEELRNRVTYIFREL